jgi:hypothetical protein
VDRRWRVLPVVLLGTSLMVALPRPGFASQPLETETARPVRAGWVQAEGVFEFQTSSSGEEYDLPFALEYGVTDRLNLLVEPVLFTAIRPSSGQNATGVGDIELTLSYLAITERAVIPALAPAFEVKLPTAKNRSIGTGETDYRFLLIASKQFGRLDTHVNFGYTLLGSPEGANFDNIFDYAFAAEYKLTPSLDLVAEVLGNTAATSTSDTAETGGPVTPATTTPEAPGTEVSGLLGIRYYFEPNLFVSLGASYDNNDAFLVRPGVTWAFEVFRLPFIND